MLASLLDELDKIGATTALVVSRNYRNTLGLSKVDFVSHSLSKLSIVGGHCEELSGSRRPQRRPEPRMPCECLLSDE